MSYSSSRSNQGYSTINNYVNSYTNIATEAGHASSTLMIRAYDPISRLPNYDYPLTESKYLKEVNYITTHIQSQENYLNASTFGIDANLSPSSKYFSFHHHQFGAQFAAFEKVGGPPTQFTSPIAVRDWFKAESAFSNYIHYLSVATSEEAFADALGGKGGQRLMGRVGIFEKLAAEFLALEESYMGAATRAQSYYNFILSGGNPNKTPSLRRKGGCFTQNTPINTVNGPIPIKELVVGDVLEDEDNTVLNVIKVLHKGPLLTFGFEDGTLIEVTPEHPIFSVDYDLFREAKLFVKGEAVKDINDNDLMITEITSEYREVLVYTLTTTKHVFYVNNILVHNKRGVYAPYESNRIYYQRDPSEYPEQPDRDYSVRGSEYFGKAYNYDYLEAGKGAPLDVITGFMEQAGFPSSDFYAKMGRGRYPDWMQGINISRTQIVETAIMGVELALSSRGYSGYSFLGPQFLGAAAGWSYRGGLAGGAMFNAGYPNQYPDLQAYEMNRAATSTFPQSRMAALARAAYYGTMTTAAPLEASWYEFQAASYNLPSSFNMYTRLVGWIGVNAATRVAAGVNMSSFTGQLQQYDPSYLQLEISRPNNIFNYIYGIPTGQQMAVSVGVNALWGAAFAGGTTVGGTFNIGNTVLGSTLVTGLSLLESVAAPLINRALVPGGIPLGYSERSRATFGLVLGGALTAVGALGLLLREQPQAMGSFLPTTPKIGTFFADLEYLASEFKVGGGLRIGGVTLDEISTLNSAEGGAGWMEKYGINVGREWYTGKINPSRGLTAEARGIEIPEAFQMMETTIVTYEDTLLNINTISRFLGDITDLGEAFGVKVPESMGPKGQAAFLKALGFERPVKNYFGGIVGGTLGGLMAGIVGEAVYQGALQGRITSTFGAYNEQIIHLTYDFATQFAGQLAGSQLMNFPISGAMPATGWVAGVGGLIAGFGGAYIGTQLGGYLYDKYMNNYVESKYGPQAAAFGGSITRMGFGYALATAAMLVPEVGIPVGIGVIAGLGINALVGYELNTNASFRQSIIQSQGQIFNQGKPTYAARAYGSSISWIGQRAISIQNYQNSLAAIEAETSLLAKIRQIFTGVPATITSQEMLLQNQIGIDQIDLSQLPSNAPYGGVRGGRVPNFAFQNLTNEINTKTQALAALLNQEKTYTSGIMDIERAFGPKLSLAYAATTLATNLSEYAYERSAALRPPGRGGYSIAYEASLYAANYFSELRAQALTNQYNLITGEQTAIAPYNEAALALAQASLNDPRIRADPAALAKVKQLIQEFSPQDYNYVQNIAESGRHGLGAQLAVARWGFTPSGYANVLRFNTEVLSMVQHESSTVRVLIGEGLAFEDTSRFMDIVAHGVNPDPTTQAQHLINNFVQSIDRVGLGNALRKGYQIDPNTGAISEGNAIFNGSRYSSAYNDIKSLATSPGAGPITFDVKYVTFNGSPTMEYSQATYQNGRYNTATYIVDPGTGTAMLYSGPALPSVNSGISYDRLINALSPEAVQGYTGEGLVFDYHTAAWITPGEYTHMYGGTAPPVGPIARWAAAQQESSIRDYTLGLHFQEFGGIDPNTGKFVVGPDHLPAGEPIGTTIETKGGSYTYLGGKKGWIFEVYKPGYEGQLSGGYDTSEPGWDQQYTYDAGSKRWVKNPDYHKLLPPTDPNTIDIPGVDRYGTTPSQNWRAAHPHGTNLPGWMKHSTTDEDQYGQTGLDIITTNPTVVHVSEYGQPEHVTVVPLPIGQQPMHQRWLSLKKPIMNYNDSALNEGQSPHGAVVDVAFGKSVSGGDPNVSINIPAIKKIVLDTVVDLIRTGVVLTHPNNWDYPTAVAASNATWAPTSQKIYDRIARGG